jgi:hypothetical protein
MVPAGGLRISGSPDEAGTPDGTAIGSDWQLSPSLLMDPARLGTRTAVEASCNLAQDETGPPGSAESADDTLARLTSYSDPIAACTLSADAPTESASDVLALLLAHGGPIASCQLLPDAVSEAFANLFAPDAPIATCFLSPDCTGGAVLTATPEPGTWLTLGTFLGAAGWIARRRRVA